MMTSVKDAKATVEMALDEHAKDCTDTIHLGEQFRLEGMAEKKEQIIKEHFDNTGFVMPGMLKKFKDKVDEVVKTELAELGWELIPIQEGSQKKTVLYLGQKI